jgi:hypothetical protein
MSKTQKLIIIAIVVFCVLGMVFVCNTQQVAYAYSLSDDLLENSEANPYLITSSQDMDDLSAEVYAGDDLEDKYFILTTSISLSTDYVPIGSFSCQFKGHFDGNNNTITINSDIQSDYVGVFGAVGSTGEVSNLRVDGTVKGYNTVGSIAGYNVGVIDNCINYATVQTSDSAKEGIGGIVGVNYGTITDCINLGAVCGNKYIGGIAGKNLYTGNSVSTINGVINLGNISYYVGANSYIVGGLVGQNDGILKNGYNYSLITNSGDSIGSIIGYLNTTTITVGSMNCYNNNSKCAITLIGSYAQASLPTNYSQYSLYDFLGMSVLTFEDSIMTIPDFEVGYGYFPMLSQFVLESAITDEVKHCLFDSGDGTESTPFVISNNSQWELFTTNTFIHDYDGVYVDLETDISQSTPLSNFDNKFNGVLDGEDNTITLSISDTDFAGMFRYIGINGVVKNLNMTGWVSISGSYAGSVAGYSNGLIENVINGARIVGTSYLGGLVGEIYNSSSITNLIDVKNSGSIEGTNYLGGITGYGYNVETSGYLVNSGSVQGSNLTSGSMFGGIFGQLQNSSVITYTNWLNSGVINATKGEKVGGLVGSIDNADIEASMNIGAVTGIIYVGGIAGELNGGDLSSVGVICDITSANYTGGLIGYLSEEATITDSYFSGEFYKLAKNTVTLTNFYILACTIDTLNLSKAYYNSDLIDGEGINDTDLISPNIQGIGASYIQLTNVNGSAHSISFDSDIYWNIADMELSYGYYPVTIGFDIDDTSIINAIAKYTYFNSGDGTLTTPFAISKAQQLYNLSYLHNNYFGYTTLYYSQTADITLDDNFTPIGDDVNVFSGNYDGDYFEIYNLNVYNSSTDYSGLFGKISSATISEVCIASGSISGITYIGGIAGYSTSSYITNCYSLIDVDSLSSSYGGGIVGCSFGTHISNCFNTGRITIEGNYAGGILGYGNATTSVSNCFNMGMVTGDGAITGGLIGYNNAGSLSASYNAGTVKVTTEEYVGGLVGISSGTMVNCYSISKVEYITTSKSGALAGQIDTGVTNYLTCCFYNSDICSLYPHSATTITTYNAKTTDQMETSSGDDNFVDCFNDNTLFQFGLSSTKDSHYAPRLSVFISSGNDSIENYSTLSVRLKLFGWDDESTSTWGTENNPYIISTLSQMATLSLLNETYNYSDCYFALANDIDMRVDGSISNFSPIGEYTNALTYYYFDGTFDGCGYTLQYLYINEVVNYVGLFGYLGPNATVKNLIIDSNSTITTTGNYVGSFVGRNISEYGAIDRCVSYATVSGGTNIGGIVGYTFDNTSITNCLFDGEISGSSYVYGVVGMVTNAASDVTTTNSWYIFRYDELTNDYSYLVARDEGYLNNGYSSTLFVDKNGAVSVNIDTTAEDDDFIIFVLIPDTYYTGYYMDANNNKVSSNYSYNAINNTTLKSIYARFTLPVSTNITGGDDIISVSGTGNYYSGQTVTLKTTFSTYGYFINIFDFDNATLSEEFAEYTLSNDGEQVWVVFSMPDSFDDISLGKIVNFELLLVSTYITVTTLDAEYTGADNDASVVVESAGSGYFDNIELVYYYGTQKTKTTDTNNAGEYEVRSRLVIDNIFGLTDGLFLGIQSDTYSISTKELSSCASWVWDGLLGKEYDATNYKTSVDVTINIEGIIVDDESGVVVEALFTWSDSNVATNLDITVSSFALSGIYATNYSISSTLEVIATGTGYITAKAITVSINSSNLTQTYDNSEPQITNITVTGSLGDVELEYTLTQVDSDNNPVVGWSDTWDVGTYSIEVSTTNINYEVSLYENYYLNIEPIIVSSISYKGYSNLIYSGSNLAATIYGTYSTLNSGTDYVTLTYYYELAPTIGLSTVIDAGSYEAIPAINESIINYALSNANSLSFVVSRADRVENLVISTAISQATYGDADIELTIENINSDGTMTLNKLVDTDRGNLELIDSLGVYTLKMLSYGNISFTITESGCQNYNDRTSNQIDNFVINSKTIYVGIENREWYYGDDIVLNLQYSWDIDQLSLLTDEEFSAITNFVEPAYYWTASELIYSEDNYEIKILGGKSDGNKFYTATTNYININKRLIKILVTEESNNSKIYGEDDLSINYSIEDATDSDNIIDILPNGDELELFGALTRVEGEDVGSYEISAGTLLSSNNPNYNIISYNILVNYEINQKELKLVMPSYSKSYLDDDPEFTLILETGYSFVGNDTIETLDILVTRQAGEELGSYNYDLIVINGGDNYIISSIEKNYKFVINQAIPSITTSVGSATWGDELYNSIIYGRATNNLGEEIDGTFSWNYGDLIINEMEYEADASFIPSSSNYSTVNLKLTVTADKRKVSISYSGVFDYTYVGVEISKSYVIKLTNLVTGYTPVVEGEYDNLPVAVGEYILTPVMTDDCNGVYELDDFKTAKIRIYPASITVTVDGGEIAEGSSYTPTITYVGFVNGETESVLETKATVGEVPTEVGYYILTPSGASSNNYTFNYISSAFVVKKLGISNETVSITGVLAPEVNVVTTIVGVDTYEYGNVETTIGEFSGSSWLKPNKSEMVEYIKFDITGTLDSDTEYAVKLSTTIEDGMDIYLIYADGSIVELTDYTIDSDGNIIFECSNIEGICVFSEKNIFNYILGYLPITGIVLGLIGIIILFIYISKIRKRVEIVRREKYLR